MRYLLAAMSLSLFVTACSGNPPEEAASKPPIDESAVEIVGKRYDVRVELEGYSPTSLKMPVGEEATLVFTRVTEATCGEVVVIPSLGIEKELPLRKAVSIPFTPANTGEVAFACGMNMMKGAIIVVE